MIIIYPAPLTTPLPYTHNIYHHKKYFQKCPGFLMNYFKAYFIFLLQEINIEFEGHSVEDDDFHGIKMLLQQVIPEIQFV